MGFSYFNAANLFVKVSQSSPVRRLCCVCVCVCLCVCVCNEAVGISDCITLMIRCLVNDELERMWKEVVVA
jgi:hypothetical protein